MESRRDFLKTSAIATIGVAIPASLLSQKKTGQSKKSKAKNNYPIVVSTWNHGVPANKAAWEVLSTGGYALDAVEQGVHVPEADPEVSSVGYGGFPDRDGHVTLDACIIDEKGNCGSVAFLENIMHPISVARMVLEKTPHVMLVGDGAYKFAREHGFPKEDLLTKNAKEAWAKWILENKYKPIDFNNHDTIGMLAIDSKGQMCGACTTSGLAWKIHGRVGDSPIIGAGLYVDNEVGGATATGKGESVIKIAGSFLIVELMRQGMSPKEACKTAVERIIRKQPDYKDFQVGFIAMTMQGEYGYYSLQKGFEVAVHDKDGSKLLSSEYASK